MNKFPFGTVLKIQREYTLRDIYDRLVKIKDLGMNLVVIWPAIFWWEDQSNPDYPYATGKEIMKYAEAIGLKVIMELTGQLTSLEFAPDFLMKDDYYSKSIDGHHNNKEYYFGTLNYNHPEVSGLIKKYIQDTVRAYQDFSALYGYDVWNETMFSSYDNDTLGVFQRWLKDKYRSIDEINDVWDRVYSDWSQIEFTNWTWASIMPAVDYYQFRKDNISMILQEFNQWIKEVDSHHLVIADNIHSMVTEDWSFERPQDDWGSARQVDQYGISFYPKVKEQGKQPYLRSEIFTAIHAASPNGRFYISEMQSHNQALFTPMSVVYPHDIRFWNYEAISRGGKGIIYWMWEPFIKGLQLSGRGLVNFSGQYTKRALEAKNIIELIHSQEETFDQYMPLKPKIAILYDKHNHDFIKALSRNYQDLIAFGHYTDALSGLYKTLWELNVPVTFLSPDDLKEELLEGMDIIFVTSQILISDDLANRINQYVAKGGVFITDGRLGMLNEKGIMHQELPGGPLNCNLGITLQDVDCQGMDIHRKDSDSLATITGYFEKQILTINSGNSTVLGSFEDGTPGIVQTPFGAGYFIYIGTYLWLGQHNQEKAETLEFVRGLLEQFTSIPLCINNPQIKLSALSGEDGLVLFAFNYSEVEQVGIVSVICELGKLHQVVCLETNQIIQYQEDLSNYVFEVRLPSHQAYMFQLKF